MRMPGFRHTDLFCTRTTKLILRISGSDDRRSGMHCRAVPSGRVRLPVPKGPAGHALDKLYTDCRAAGLKVPSHANVLGVVKLLQSENEKSVLGTRNTFRRSLLRA